MSLEKTESAQFIYITYSRQGFKDVELLKTTLSSLSSNKTSIKDIILDFGSSKYLSSPEIGIMVRLANEMTGSPRIVRVIPSEELYKQFASVNLTKLEHLSIYKSRQEFAEQLKNMQKK